MIVRAERPARYHGVRVTCLRKEHNEDRMASYVRHHARLGALQVGFGRAIKLVFHGAKVSWDAGLFPYLGLDEAAQLTDSGAAELFEFRTGSDVQDGMTALLRQSVYSRLAGYEDVNDADRLSVDPVMRHGVGGRAVDRTAASTGQVGRFETEVLTHPDNLAALTAMRGQWVDRIRQRRPMKKLIVDMDSSVSETYGQQGGSMYNDHFACACYHPLFIFNHDGDVERALRRDGNVASADDWRSALDPVIERYRDVDAPRFFRGDAAFAIPELYDLLEAEGYEYVIRLKANQMLERHIGHLLTRPAGRPPTRPQRFYHSFDYQAKSWDHPQRVVAKVEWHQGELVPRVGFIVTNLGGGSKSVVDFYNGRGTAEQWIKEGKHAIRWSLTTLRNKLIKIGAKVVHHALYVTFQLAEVAAPRLLYCAILERLRRFAALSPRAAPI